MRASRLMATRPPAAQLVLCTVPPLVLGIVVGIVLDLSSAIYGLLLIVAAIGGVLAGTEHASAGEGAQRGLVGGALFGAGILAGHHILSERAKASLPHPEALEPIVTGLVSIPLGAIGGALRARSERRAAPAAESELALGG